MSALKIKHYNKHRYVYWSLGRRMTSFNYTIMILTAWVNGFFWALMPIVGWASYAPDPTGATCTINWRKNNASFVSYTVTVIAINFVMPLVVMIYCYYNVSQKIKQYTPSNCPEYINRDWSNEVAVTKVRGDISFRKLLDCINASQSTITFMLLRCNPLISMSAVLPYSYPPTWQVESYQRL
uniref:G-protein coupled receptors family 1 profile domain-containing protein n=1 Tax=Sarcophilus harrisii TaxID=9305 RepID=A0A7N4NX66_SARHA